MMAREKDKGSGWTGAARMAACLALLALIWAGAVHAWTLPDTGQTTCYNLSSAITCPSPGDAYYGQDANYNGSQPHYQQNSVSGSVVTVTDLNTGLIWQYADDGTTRSQADSATYCAGLSLGGSDDWRLPTARELGFLIQMSASGSACPSSFSCQSNGYYWTSTPLAGDATKYMRVKTSTAELYSTASGQACYVRCVRP